MRQRATPPSRPTRQSRAGRRQPVGVARVGLGQHVQHQRAIGNGARHRADMGDRIEGRGRIGRHPAIGRLQPVDAGKTCRNPDRPAAVGADMQRTHAAGRRDGSAAARPAGSAFQVPGIARDAGQLGIGHTLPAEFRGRGLAQQHRAMGLEPRHRRCVLGPILIAGDQGRAAQRRPALGQDEILDRGRHTIDQTLRPAGVPAGLRCAGGGQRTVLVEKAEGIDLVVQRMDRCIGCLGRFDRRQGLATIGGDELRRRHRGQFIAHDADLPDGILLKGWAA